MQERLSIFNSKKMVVRVLRSVMFALLVLTMVFPAGMQYQGAAGKNTVNAFTKSRYDDFYALPNNSLDIAFIGSSHSYCTFDPENFDSVLGTNSFQFGTPLQHPDTTYFCLQEIYRLQTPKVVVMEVYWAMLQDGFEMKQADALFDVVRNETLKEEYQKEVFPLNEKIKYWFWPIRFQQDYFAWKSSEEQKKLQEKYGLAQPETMYQEGVEEYRSKGYVYCDMKMLPGEFDETNQFKGMDGKEFHFNTTQKKYMEKIIKLCEEKGSKLVFVTAPVAPVSMEYIKNYEYIYGQVQKFAQEQGIDYIDYNVVNQREGLLTNDNFRDDAHLNDSGVKIVDAHFLQWLLQVAGDALPQAILPQAAVPLPLEGQTLAEQTPAVPMQ